MNHTPGDWFVCESEAVQPTSVGDKFLAVTNGERLICRVSAVELLDEQDSMNALLIANAPKLVAICQLADELLAGWCLRRYINYGSMSSGFDKELEDLELKLDEVLFAVGIPRGDTYKGEGK